ATWPSAVEARTRNPIAPTMFEIFMWGLLLVIFNRGAAEIADSAADQASAHYCCERCAGYRCDARAQRRATDRGLLGCAHIFASAAQARRGKYQNHCCPHLVPLGQK